MRGGRKTMHSRPASREAKQACALAKTYPPGRIVPLNRCGGNRKLSVQQSTVTDVALAPGSRGFFFIMPCITLVLNLLRVAHTAAR